MKLFFKVVDVCTYLLVGHAMIKQVVYQF
jgi:hypothetical protein